MKEEMCNLCCGKYFAEEAHSKEAFDIIHNEFLADYISGLRGRRWKPLLNFFCSLWLQSDLA